MNPRLIPGFGASFAGRRSSCLAAALTVAASAASAPSPRQFYRLESAVILKTEAPNWDYITFPPGRSYLYIRRREDGVAVHDVAARKVIRNTANSAPPNATNL